MVRSTLMLGLSTTLSFALLTACEPPDERLPKQPAVPGEGHVAPTVVPKAPKGGGVTTTAVTKPPATKPTPASAMLDGTADALRMLNTPKWADAGEFTRYCDDSIARATTVRKRLQKAGRADAVVLADFNKLSLELDTVSGLASLMFNVNPNKAVRDAGQACQQKLSKFTTDVGLDRALFDAISKVDASKLTGDPKRVVEHTIRDFKRAGVDKDKATRDRIAKINARIVEIGQDFRKNINADVRSIKITDASKLKGLPQDWIDKHKPDDKGVITVTTDYPDFFPFQRYCADGELRKQLYQQFMKRAWPQNEPLIKEILTLRKEFAGIIGFESWADYITQDKMTGSAKVVDAFIKDIEKIVRPRNDADVAALLERKKKDDPTATTIESHDRFYYVSKVREDKHGFDEKVLRSYFSYPLVKQGIFDLYGELFGLTFRALPNYKTWHPSVEAWEMLSDGKLVGRFFLDNHPRSDKYKHAAMFPIQTGLKKGRIPWASLVCNFPDPSEGGGRGLMDHGQVETFFHEFGHLIHHLVARGTDWVDLSGINVEWDFVEAPSQILEEWASSHEVLARFARHSDTGEVIPKALVDKLVSASEFGKGLSLMRQVFYTAYSFYIHSADPKTLDLDAFSAEMYSKYSPFPAVKGGKIFSNFGHLIGYSAIYYTYQWSLAIAKDLFTRFETEGVMNKKVAMDYRKLILEPGGTKDAEELVTDFLGRKRTLKAYRDYIQKGAAK